MIITSLWFRELLVHPRGFAIQSTAVATALTAATSVASAQPVPITHVIVIMQENRSFDNYFGTYPGANGIPPNTCQPLNPSDPGQGCVMPFHDMHDVNAGGPHTAAVAQASLDDGITTALMDGFVYQQTIGLGPSCGSARVKPQGALAPDNNCMTGRDRWSADRRS